MLQTERIEQKKQWANTRNSVFFRGKVRKMHGRIWRYLRREDMWVDHNRMEPREAAELHPNVTFETASGDLGNGIPVHY